MSDINMADRIELRRFVGRELLLWLWLETELFDATLSTAEHGSFGMWLEGRLVLDAGKESTLIKGTTPGIHREAKESLLRGKTPERAGLHLSFGGSNETHCTLTLRGDTLAFASLTPPAKEKEGPSALEVLKDAPKRKKKRNEDDVKGPNVDFHDRMAFARDVEGLVTALYRDFLKLRLSSTWDADVVPLLERWVAGKPIDAERYRRARDKVIGTKATRRAS